MNDEKKKGAVISAGAVLAGWAALDKIIPTMKKIWYWIKKPVPLIQCPQCKGRGQTPDIIGLLVTCHRCNGKGTIRETEATPQEIDEYKKRVFE